MPSRYTVYFVVRICELCSLSSDWNCVEFILPKKEIPKYMSPDLCYDNIDLYSRKNIHIYIELFFRVTCLFVYSLFANTVSADLKV